MPERGKIKKTFKLSVLCAVFLLVCLGMVIYAKATEVSAVIVGYQDRATTGLRASQLCEVYTSGFSKDARLAYTYYNGLTKDAIRLGGWIDGKSNIKLFNKNRTSDTSDGCRSLYLGWKEYSKALEGYKYFAVCWVPAQKGTVSVKVKDINPSSRTYGREAEASYTDFKESNFGYDLGGTYGIVEGKWISTLDMLDEGGVAEAKYCYLVSGMRTTSCQLVSESENGMLQIDKLALTDATFDYYIKADKPGTAKLRIDAKNGSNFLGVFHYGQTGSGTASIRVFARPLSTPTLHTVTLHTKTEEGVTYTVNGESITCTEAGQELLFGAGKTHGPLTPNKKYEVTVSQSLSGKTAKTSFDVETSNSCRVRYDYQGIGAEGNLPDEDIPYNTPSGNRPTADGFEFAGWYDNPSCTGDNYLTAPVTKEEITLYAKWQARTYRASLSLQLDNTPYSGADVALCQDGVEKYRLSEVSQRDGFAVYEAEVEYTSYKPAGGTENGYDIYLNGKESGYYITLDGGGQSGETFGRSLYCYRAGVRLTLDKLPWKGQEVLLNGGQKGLQTLSFDQALGAYTSVLVYDTAENLKDGEYFIYVNGSRLQRWDDAGDYLEPESLTVTPDTLGNMKEAEYYSVNAAVRKDGEGWADANVTLRQNGRVMETLVWDKNLLGGGSYRSSGIYDNGTPYGLFVKNVYTGEDSGVSVSSTYDGIINYYTASFQDKETVYFTQVIREGANARKPVNPYKSGKTFQGWYQKEEGAGSPEEDARYFESGNTIQDIRQKTLVWARWEQPAIRLGSCIKCGADGAVDGAGQYYRLANLVITGFPSESRNGPVKTAVIEAEGVTEAIRVEGSADSLTGVYDWGGLDCSYTVNRSRDGKIILYFTDDGAGRTGWTIDAAQEFLRNEIVIRPSAAEETDHTVNIRIFGATAE